MTTPRWGLAAVMASNGKLYAFGGGNDTTGFTIVEEYDPTTDVWTTRGSMTSVGAFMGVASLNGKIYLIGGERAGGTSALVEEYDPATGGWTSRASMPTV